MRIWTCNKQRRNCVFVLAFVTVIPTFLYLEFLIGSDYKEVAFFDLETSFLRIPSVHKRHAHNLSTEQFEFVKFPSNSNATCPNLQKCVSNQEEQQIHNSWNIFVVIKSRPKHFERRKVIRKTWGSIRFVGEGLFEFVFLMGQEQRNETRLLRREHERYGDILQYKGPDKIKHVPIKAVVELQWIAERLSDQQLFMSINDNIDINPVSLHDFIHNTMNVTLHNRWPDFPMICLHDHVKTFHVSADPKSLLYASPEQFKWKTFPPSCAGGFYITGGRIVKELYAESRHMQHMRDGGVWVTGLLLRKTGMPEKMMLSAPEDAAWRLSDLKVMNKTTRSARKWRNLSVSLKNMSHCRCV